MTEQSIIWSVDPDEERADGLKVLEEAWANVADMLALVHGVLRGKLPPDIATAVTLQYARILMTRRFDVCDDCAVMDDGADWHEDE